MASCRMGSSPAGAHDVQFVEVPRQEAHVELHERQPSTPESVVPRNIAWGHVEVHVLAPESYSAPGRHEVHDEALESEQVAHEASHATHVLLASANLPSGHAATHEPSSKNLEPEVGHDRHEDEVAPLQVAHEEWQLEQVPCELTTSTNVPDEGHAATQLPLCRNGVPPLALQLRHWLALGPLHVAHAEAHGSHTDELLAYLPAGVHEARHEPGRSKNGVAVAQLVHSPALGPEQVEHEAWHVMHVSAEDDEPPAHV